MKRIIVTVVLLFLIVTSIGYTRDWKFYDKCLEEAAASINQADNSTFVSAMQSKALVAIAKVMLAKEIREGGK